MLQMRRSRGAFSGFLLMLLGLWGALIPFVGPYFDYAYTPDKAWTYNTGRLWLEILPGAAVFLGGGGIQRHSPGRGGQYKSAQHKIATHSGSDSNGWDAADAAQ